MDLREKIVKALYEPPESQDGPLAGIAHRVAQERAQHRADAVMGVVEAEQERQKALFLQAAADQPGIPDYAHEALVRSLEGGQ